MKEHINQRNLDHPTLIYLALINVACTFFGTNLYPPGKMKLTCLKRSKNEAKIN